MRRKITIILLLIIIGIAAVIAYFYYEEHKEKDYIILYGNVDVRQVSLGFRVPGRVNEMFFQEGDLIPPGVLMGVLDKQPYLDELMQAEAALASTQASLSNSIILLKRRQELIGDGSISQEDLDNAVANNAVLEATLKNNKAAVAVAATNLSFTEVYSPSEGVILSRVREPGTVVNPGDPIYTLSITTPMWIRAFIPEPYLGTIYPNMQAKVYTDTPNGNIYDGYIGFISPVAEFTPKTVETTQLRTDLVYRLRIYIPHPDGGLRQGMPVTVKLALPQKEHAQEMP